MVNFWQSINEKFILIYHFFDLQRRLKSLKKIPLNFFHVNGKLTIFVAVSYLLPN